AYLTDVISDKDVADIASDVGEISDNTITMLTEWDPGLPSTELIDETRGYRIARVIIHAHSVYSHDGCDGNSVENGNPEENCVLQLRDAICKLNLNGIFMTDHAGSLADEEDFTKLYYPREGDTPVIENEIQTGNQLTCPNGAKPVIMVGSENDIMPIGITAHPSSDINERKKIYDSVDETSIDAFRKVNGVVCTAHSEGKEDDYLIGSSLECMEIYNFHVSILSSSGLVVLADYMNQPEKMPHPDLAFLAFYEPLKLQLTKWYTTAEKRNISPIIGTDIHRNVVKKALSDGERLDSYRRFMRWFTNFLLVKDYKPSEFKKAIKEGRIYVVAEGLGTPNGFDFYAETRNGIADTGKTIRKADFKKFVIKIPEVTGIDNEDVYVKARLFKIKDKSEIEILKPVARSEKKIIEVSDGIDEGVYAVQILLTPMHLKRVCKRWASEYIKEFVWIYSNTIRVE
ncbi:MAG: hypothetical protein N3B13_10950, partial [Deltaproteobacteria bacterium]|nr:hypothetical protein [Deltaproteobacteria bacterium]